MPSQDNTGGLADHIISEGKSTNALYQWHLQNFSAREGRSVQHKLGTDRGFSGVVYQAGCLCRAAACNNDRLPGMSGCPAAWAAKHLEMGEIGVWCL